MMKKHLLFSLSIPLLLPLLATAETNQIDRVETKKEKPWLAAPLVVANPSFGNGLGAVGMYFFNTDKGNTNNPASSVTGIGMYSDTDSYFLGLFGRTFWKEDTWRINAGVAHPKINNEFNIDGIPEEVRFTTTVLALFTRVDRRVYKDFFLGGKAMLLDVSYSNPNAAAQDYFNRADIEDSTSGQLGVVGAYDTRDHTRYPTRGNQSELGWTAVPEEWGAIESYSITEGFSNQYLSFFERQVLALRAYGRFTPSGTPYSGLSTLGRKGDLRGYTAGENVAENLIALQGEYRMMFTKKVGGVAFAGISQLYNGSLKHTTSDDFYPSGGIGLRYVLNAENKMNFRFDYAWGSEDEKGFYVSVGEAF